jgi:hypothetical protein
MRLISKALNIATSFTIISAMTLSLLAEPAKAFNETTFSPAIAVTAIAPTSGANVATHRFNLTVQFSANNNSTIVGHNLTVWLVGVSNVDTNWYQPLVSGQYGQSFASSGYHAKIINFSSASGTIQLTFEGLPMPYSTNYYGFYITDSTNPAFAQMTSLQYNYTGTLAPVYRFWSDKMATHFYTADAAEQKLVDELYDDATWLYEGIAYFVPQKTGPTTCGAGFLPVYRFWSDVLQSHFYTINTNERQFVKDTWADTWSFDEGEVFCASSAQQGTTEPIYRFWSNQNQAHFYTINVAEKDYILANYPAEVWQLEGATLYAYK